MASLPHLVLLALVLGLAGCSSSRPAFVVGDDDDDPPGMAGDDDDDLMDGGVLPPPPPDADLPAAEEALGRLEEALDRQLEAECGCIVGGAGPFPSIEACVDALRGEIDVDGLFTCLLEQVDAEDDPGLRADYVEVIACTADVIDAEIACVEDLRCDDFEGRDRCVLASEAASQACLRRTPEFLRLTEACAGLGGPGGPGGGGAGF